MCNNFRCIDKRDEIYNGNMSMPGMECPVIYECPVERVCHREIHHHVPQDYPFMSYELMINKYKLKSYYEIVLLS